MLVPDRDAYYLRIMAAPIRTRRRGQADDQRQVMDAAAVLGVREFELFRLAWRRWWDGEPDEKALERFFVAYMFQQVAPPWVRHFCREVLARETAEYLDPADFGVDPVARREPPVRFGKVYVAAALAVMLVLYPALLRITYEPQTPAPLACELGPGMRFFAGLAHALADREAPGCLPRESSVRSR